MEKYEIVKYNNDFNKRIDELENVSHDMKNAASISVEMEKSIKTFDLSIEKINEALVEVKKYEEIAWLILRKI